MTLLELIVVIALLGLILAVAAPTFMLPSEKKESGLTAVLATARRAAILRGEPVTLAFDIDGGWRLDGDATPISPPIATGKLDPSAGALRVHVSPLGTCFAEGDGTRSAADWDALDCKPSPGPEGAAR